MCRLENNLKRELADSTRIVSHHWRFPTWPAETVHGDMILYRTVGTRYLGPAAGDPAER